MKVIIAYSWEEATTKMDEVFAIILDSNKVLKMICIKSKKSLFIKL